MSYLSLVCLVALDSLDSFKHSLQGHGTSSEQISYQSQAGKQHRPRLLEEVEDDTGVKALFIGCPLSCPTDVSWLFPVKMNPATGTL